MNSLIEVSETYIHFPIASLSYFRIEPVPFFRKIGGGQIIEFMNDTGQKENHGTD